MRLILVWPIRVPQAQTAPPLLAKAAMDDRDYLYKIHNYYWKKTKAYVLVTASHSTTSTDEALMAILVLRNKCAGEGRVGETSSKPVKELGYSPIKV